MKFKNKKNQLTVWFFVVLGICFAILDSGLDAIKFQPPSFVAFLPIIVAHIIGNVIGVTLVWFLYRWWMNKTSQP